MNLHKYLVIITYNSSSVVHCILATVPNLLRMDAGSLPQKVIKTSNFLSVGAFLTNYFLPECPSLKSQ